MKKTLLALAMALSFAANAEVAVKYVHGQDAKAPKDFFNTVELSSAAGIKDTNFAVSLKAVATRTENRTNSLAGEVGASYSFVPGIYAKAGLGTQLTSSVPGYSYYNFGGGASIKVVENVRATVDVERTNAFSNPNPEFTTYKAGGEYVLGKGNMLSASFVRRIGDSNTKGVELGFSSQF